MNYLNLIYDFLVIGLLSFGGGYTTIPMVKDIVYKYDALNMEMLENFIAISESTPGPIAINLATFVGNEVAGFFGGVLATFCEILPAFIIILVFATFLKKYIYNQNVKFALSMIRPCIVGLIMAVGISLYVENVIPSLLFRDKAYILKYLGISLLIVIYIYIYKTVFSKKVSAINVIIFGGFLGIVFGYFG